jgi:hypothetical protein
LREAQLVDSLAQLEEVVGPQGAVPCQERRACREERLEQYLISHDCRDLFDGTLLRLPSPGAAA